MSNDYYFHKWKNVMCRLDKNVKIDLEYQETKAHETKLCGMVQKLSGILASYISIYNDAKECTDQCLQVQKTRFMLDIVHAITKRIIEIKTQLTKLEKSNYQFIARGLVDRIMTPLDAELKDIPEKITRPHMVQVAIDSIWTRVKEIKEKLEEEERERQLAEEAANRQDFDFDLWDMEDKKEDVLEVKTELTEEEIETKRMINIIMAQERSRQITVQMMQKRLKRERWERILSGLAKPDKPLHVRRRAVSMIQKFARIYFAIKRKRIIDCQRDTLLGLRMCKKPSEEAKTKSKEIKSKRIELRKKYEEEWKHHYEKLKNKCLKINCDEIKEDYRDEIRTWFHKWYKEAWFFHDIPKPTQGGSILILREEVPLPAEWKQRNQEYIEQMKANKEKTPQQLKLEKKQADRESRAGKLEEARQQKMQEKMLEKMMKNPQMHPGFQYPMSKETVHIMETIQSYHMEWKDLDIAETMDVKEKYILDIDKNNAWADAKMALRPTVDEDMRNEFKTLNQALKAEYERLEEPWPKAIMPQKFPKLPKKKKEKDTLSQEILDKMINLAMLGYLKEYTKTSLEDFKGEPNFAGDELRCNFVHAMPFGGETRNIWWERCRELIHGFNKILLVGPKASGKSILAYAMATINDAVLFEIDIEPAYFSATSTTELENLAKSILVCAKATQPAVIYIKYVHRLFYSKVPPEEPILEYELINKILVKKLLKKFHKTDKVTVIGSCINPWLTRSAKLLKLFPNVIMMPNTTYTTTVLMLKEWVLNNRMIPPDLDVSSLAHVLQGYSYGYLQKALANFLSGERIARMAAYGLDPQEIFDYILRDDSAAPVEYDNYMKWYSDKTSWGTREKKNLADQLEFQELSRKYEEKMNKRGRSAANSAASSVSNFPK